MPEDKRLWCPLCFANSDLADFFCVKERCAWWNRFEKACSLQVMARLAVRMLNRSDVEAGI